MEKNILLTIEYDGSKFHGWQRQDNAVTVQGTLEAALSALYRTEITVSGTSRTDAGVHALMQCCSYRTNIEIPVSGILHALNDILADKRIGICAPAGSIRILKAEEVSLDFHPRFSCKGKTYRYIISTGEPSVFLKDYRCFVKGNLNEEAMSQGAGYLVGTHDFKCFQAAGGNERLTTVRTISHSQVTRKGDEIVFEITGDGFLYNMVRIISGTLIEIGAGKKEPSDIEAIIESGDRKLAGFTAPAQGLYLKNIFFE